MRLHGLLKRHYPIIAVAAVYLFCLAILPLDGIWINDVGSRVIQVRSLAAGNHSDFSIRWSGSAIDPSFDYAPIAYPFGVVREDRLFSVYSPLLAVLASPFYRAFGYPGLYVLPCVASLVMLAGLGKIAGEVGLGERFRSLAILLAGLCTPVWFYSLTFWEHTIAVSFCVWAVLFLLRFLRLGSWRQLTSAALASGLATYFRHELYCFCLVVVALVLWRAPTRKVWSAVVFAGTTVFALVPVWVFQTIAMGAPFGLHIGTLVGSTPGLVQHVMSRPTMLYYLFGRASPDFKSSILLCAPFAVLFVVRPKLSPAVFKAAFPLLGLLALALSALIGLSFSVHGARFGHSPIAFVGCTNSLFPTAPLLVLGLLRCAGGDSPGGRERSSADTLWLLAVLYALAYWLAAPVITKWGVHWGNRYLLVLYPLLVILAAANLSSWLPLTGGSRRPWAALSRLAVALAVLASLAAQVWSISILSRKMDFSARLNREVGARPEQAVITSLWWVGQELYDQFDKKQIFLVRTGEQRDDLIKRLLQSGHSSYLAVLLAKEALPSGAGAHPIVVNVSDRGLNYWDVDLVAVNISSGVR